MKRITIYTLFLLLLLSACNNDKTDNDGTTPTTPLPALPLPTEAPAEPTTNSPSANPLEISDDLRPIVIDNDDPALPKLCRFRSDRSVYINLQDEICFAYPNNAILAEFDPTISRMGVFAPPPANTNLPVGATMILEAVNPIVDNVSLLNVTQTYLGQFQGAEIRTSPAGLGHAPAYLLDGVPLDFPTRNLMSIHGTGFYQLMFYPIGDGYDALKDDMDDIWRSVTLSFSYLPQAFEDRYAQCPIATETAVPYLNVEEGYCLLFPRYFSVATPDVANGLGAEQRAISFDGPVLDIDLTRGALEILVVDNAGNSSLADTVAERINDNGTTSDTTIDGQPAILVEESTENYRQLFAQANGDLYIFTLTPATQPDADVMVDLDNVWNAFTDSFTFLPKDETLSNDDETTPSEPVAEVEEANDDTPSNDDEATPSEPTAEAEEANDDEAAPAEPEPTAEAEEESVAVTGTPTFSAITDVTITGGGGIQIAATFYPGQGEGARPAVLLLHMNNSNRGVWADFAAQLNAAGYSALAIDMRGHGETGNSKNWDAARGDTRAAWTYLTNLPNIDADNTAVIGGSIGSNMTLLVGVDKPQIKTVVLLSPGLDYLGVETADEIVAYGDRPILIVASNEDSYSADSSSALAENAGNSQSELILYDGAGHGTSMFDANVGLAETLLTWLNSHLK